MHCIACVVTEIGMQQSQQLVYYLQVYAVHAVQLVAVELFISVGRDLYRSQSKDIAQRRHKTLIHPKDHEPHSISCMA